MATSTESLAGSGEVDPERVALVWMDSQQALIVRWEGEPVVERIESDVVPRRRAVGSVRRGPARPDGGGSVPGHGTEGRHLEEMDRYLGKVAGRLLSLDRLEVIGRGRAHEQFAEMFRDLERRLGGEITITTATTSRRPSERQLMARLRKLAERELPRRRQGRYRRPPLGPTTPTGRPTPEAEGRHTLRPPRVAERQEIELEVEAMLSDAGTDAEPGA